MDSHDQQGADEVPAALDEVTSALESLADIVDRKDNVRLALQGVCEQVIRAVPGVDAASVTLVGTGTPQTAASTDDLIVELDLQQYRSNDGPCLEAARTGQVVRVAVDDAAEKWPAFTDLARTSGIGSFLSAPLTIDDTYSGALNCYSLKHHGFAELDEQLLTLYVTAVEVALRSLRQAEAHQKVAAQLRVALDSRAIIEQAKGMLMAIHGLTGDEAFDRLVAESQRKNIKLRQVAEQFVADVVSQARKAP